MDIISKTLQLNNIIIESRKSDHFINATQMCKAGNKKFNDWNRLESVKELCKQLEIVLKNESDNQNIESEYPVSIQTDLKLIYIKKGGLVSQQGTWIHPDLAIQLAQWISAAFAIKVSRWIRELVITGSVSIDSHKTDDEINKLMQELKLKDEIIAIKEQENKWLQIKAQNCASYTKYIDKTTGLYIGAHTCESKNYIYKFGKSFDPEVRATKHSGSTCDLNKFKTYKSYITYASLHLPTENYIQHLFNPFWVNKKRVEHMIIHPIILDNIIEQFINHTDSYVKQINYYITTLEQSNFNYEIVEDILIKLYTKVIKEESAAETDEDEASNIEYSD